MHGCEVFKQVSTIRLSTTIASIMVCESMPLYDDFKFMTTTYLLNNQLKPKIKNRM